MTIKLYKRNDFDFWTTLHSRWGDMDGLRHINNAKYLTYMENARLDLYMQIGHALDKCVFNSDPDVVQLESIVELRKTLKNVSQNAGQY